MGQNPFGEMYKPLYGFKKTETDKLHPKKLGKSQKRDLPKEPMPKPRPTETIQPKPQPNNLSLYEGFINDKRLLLILAILAIITIVIGYIIYKQKQNKRYLSSMAKRFKQLKKYDR